METPQDTTPRKRLTSEQGVQAACFLFELNTREQDLMEMAQRAGIPCDADAEVRGKVIEEWYGFVHAAVVYGLQNCASNGIMADYLRSTRVLLTQVAQYDADRIEAFIDQTFAGYIGLMARNEQKQCPALFFRRTLGVSDLTELPKERVAFLSGMMAITMCAILDKLNAYDFVDEPEEEAPCDCEDNVTS
ncbi:MAG: hypothetical protein RRY20_07760 [Bilophila sp.]